jgi:hypothetical protein
VPPEGGSQSEWVSGAGSLLVNWLYYHPVGHAVEALRIAVAFKAANPDLYIAVLLNAQTATELVSCTTEIDALYTIDLGRPDAPVESPSIAHIPRDWDYVFDGRAGQPSGWPALDACQTELRSWLRAGAFRGDGLPARIDTLPHVALRLNLPGDARAFAQDFWEGSGEPRLSLLPGSGSGAAPSLTFWTAFLEGVFGRHSNAEVAVLGSSDRRRSWTHGFGPPEVEQLRQRFGRVRDAFDLGLLRQLAIAERCAAHISPHSGMSFAAQSVGTPWLAVSGGPWPEYLLNGVPHRSIFPACSLYPCFGQMLDECQARSRERRRVLCREDEALMPTLPALLDGLDEILRDDISAEASAGRHCAELRVRRPECVDPHQDSIWDWPAFVTPRG